MTATHPTDRELGDFLLGKLDESTDWGVESHLDECPSCRDRAAAARADDTFTELLAAARTRLDSRRMSAPTPTLDGAATPPAFAPTLALDAPGADATGLARDIPPALASHPKYRPVRRLGTGGMGTVWLAEHQVMHRPVAIKVIRPDLLARPGATGRFLREVRAAAKLHHPNIVTAFDAEPAGDSCLLVMEYVPGQTLGERLEAGPLPAAEACRAVRDAARGLAHAHAHGLVHRDVKPHNLIRMASPDASAPGVVKVLDFGLAGVGAGEAVAAGGDGLTGAGMVVGTPDYIAPEQITDPHTADARADIYGLGCTLYHLLAGRPPLPDGSVMEKLAAQPTHTPDPIPGLPAALAAVLAKMLAKRAEDRYQSADEVVDALEDIIDQVRPVHRNPWSCTSKPRSWVMALVVGAAILVAGVIIKIQRDNQVITIETNDPDVEVVMKRRGEVLRVIDKKTGQQWEIDTATNQIAQADTPDGLTLGIPEKDGIVLKRDGKAVFTVTRAPAAPAADKVGEARVFRLAPGKAEIWGVDLSPDGRRFLAAGGEVRAWDMATDRQDDRFGWDAWSAYYLADGTRALVADQGVLFLRDLRTGDKTRFDARVGRVRNVVLSPDDRRAAAVSDDWGLRVWDLGTREVIATLDGAEFHANRTAAFLPNGREVLYAHTDRTLRLYDLAAGREVRSLSGHTDAIADVVVHPDGGRALTCGRDDTVRLWDLTTGHELWRQPGHGPDHGVVAFVPGGRALSGGKDGVLRVRDLATGRVTHEFKGHDGFILSVSVARNGRQALSGGNDGTVRLWRLPDPPAATGQGAKVADATTAADAYLKALDAGDFDRVWDGIAAWAKQQGPKKEDVIRTYEALAKQSGKPKSRTPNQPQYLTSLPGTPDGEYVLFNYSSRFERWDHAVEQLVLKLEPDGRWRAAGYHRQLASAPPSKDPAAAPASDHDRIQGAWQAVSGEYDADKKFTPEELKGLTMTFAGDTATLTQPGGVRQAGTFTLDQTREPKRVMITGDQADNFRGNFGIYRLDGDTLTVCMGDAQQGWPAEFKARVGDKRFIHVVMKRDTTRPVAPAGPVSGITHQLRGKEIDNGSPVRGMAFTPDGKLVVGGNALTVFDPATGKAGYQDKYPDPVMVTAPLSLTPDGKTAAVAISGSVVVYDLAAGKRLKDFAVETKMSSTFSVALSADGRAVAYSDVGAVRTRDLATSQTVTVDTAAPVGSAGLNYTPDGLLVYTTKDRLAIHRKTPGVVDKRTVGLSGLTAVSRDGKRLVVGGARDQKSGFYVFSLPDGEEESFTELPTGAGSLSLAPDGTYLAVGLIGGEVQVWDLGQKKMLGAWTPAKAIAVMVAFGPDGKTLATGTLSTVRVWEVTFVRAAPVAIAPARPDRDRILGTWRGVAAEVNGQQMPQQFLDTIRPTLTFTPDKVTGKPAGTIPKAFIDLAVAQGMLPREAATIVEKGTEGVYHLDPTKTPRQIDFTILGEVKKTGLGIYQLDGDTLKVCLSIDPAKVSERPTEFAARAGQKQVVISLRRLTPEEVVLEDVERRIDPAKGDGKSLPFALLEQNKVAVLRFGKWRLVFEGVACDSGGKTLFGIGSLFFPGTGGRGNFVDPGLRPPAPMLGQQYNGRANEIVLKNYRFELEAKGAKLVFADKTYEASDQVQTIVIARDGTTRVDPGAKK